MGTNPPIGEKFSKIKGYWRRRSPPENYANSSFKSQFENCVIKLVIKPVAKRDEHDRRAANSNSRFSSRSWSGLWSPDAIERALAHDTSSSVRGTYHRGQHWAERVKMAQWWSDYLDELKATS